MKPWPELELLQKRPTKRSPVGPWPWAKLGGCGRLRALVLAGSALR